MLSKVKIVIMASLLLHNGWAFTQTLSNKGKEFWVGYGHHQLMEPGKDNSQEMILYFSAEQAAVVTVSINGTAYSKTYTVAANSVVTSDLIPKGVFSNPSSPFDARLYTLPPGSGGTGSEGLFTKGIHIESTTPIVAYAHIYSKDNSGASMLIPVEAWGNTYMSLNTQQFFSAAYGGNRDCFSWMYVVASQNNTRVRIVPSVATRNGHAANVPFTVDLQKGQIYQILGAAKDNEASLDLTGTTVTSISNGAEPCHPVGVFSGSSQTQIACTGFNGSGDNLMQQLFPYNAWGREYLTAPSCVDNSPKQHNINIYRIIVKDPNTVVIKNGQQLYGINGNYYEYQSNTADYIRADQPIMLAQYLPSKNACGYAGDGDPEMIYVSPIEQSINHINFYRNNRQNIKVNYLSLIIPKGGLTSLKIDGITGSYDDVYDHPNHPGYAVVIKRWNAAQAQCIVESDSAFTSITYGLGGNESYGYNAGTMFGNQSGLPFFKNKYSPTSEPNTYTCVKTPVELSVLMRYKPDQLNWRLSQLAGIISPANDVLINAPVPAGTVTVRGVQYYKYTLPGYYTFAKAGTFDVPLYSAGANVPTCDQTEVITYEVRVKPGYSTNFDVVFNNCTTAENVRFAGEDIFSTKDSIKRWEWIFSDNTTASGKTIDHVLPTGNNSAELFAIDSVGCAADTFKTFANFDSKPTAAFFVNPAIVCQGGENVFTDQSVGNNRTLKSWNWNFADGTVSALQNPVKQFAAPGEYSVSLTVTDAAGCVSDTVQKDVLVNIKPVIDAGPSFTVDEGTKVTFKATANNVTDVNFRWAPSSLLDDATMLTPSYIAVHDQTFVLTATTGETSCMATDELTVKILRPVKVPNAFSPNGDGINDYWQITNLADYDKATVQVYNRYGQMVFRSVGYGTPWDGKANGNSLPVGTYYYIIELNKKIAPLTGSVTILK
jgi:gliding motility-associated-like protein